MEHSHDRKLTDAEFDAMYRELLVEVEMVQVEQMGLILCLRHHDLRAVFSEGYSVGVEKTFGESINDVRGIRSRPMKCVPSSRTFRAMLKGCEHAWKERVPVTQA